MEKATLQPHILESISDGVFTVNKEWRITSFNRAAEEITGYSSNEVGGRMCWEVFQADLCKGKCPMRKTMREERSYSNIPAIITTRDKKNIPISVSTAVLHDERGELIGGVETFRRLATVNEKDNTIVGSFRLGGMVSRSRLMKKIFSKLPKIAESDSTVLIEGDTGTGKEVLAKALHQYSSRNEKEFVAINCGALPDTLLESELFGYKAGAFTDAIKDKPGYFTLADGGTIMLDELSETSPAFQAKLLRVLEEREFQPLGGVEKEQVNIRVVAATNSNLEELVEKGHFRQDLYYRINIVRLQLPPLRQRLEDIPLLINHFIDKLNREKGKAINGIESEAMNRLVNYDYPGNIRELENLIEHAFILCSQGQIGTQHLPDYIQAVTESRIKDISSIQAIRQSSEEEAILQALKRNNYNRLAAAKELGMHKTTLFRKLKKLNIRLPKTDGRTVNHFKSDADF